MMGNFEFINTIEIEIYKKFRHSVGWGDLHHEQVEELLKNSICFSCLMDGKTVGIYRILWDGGYTAYLADVIVDEKFRGHGIGKKLVEHAIEEVKSRMQPGWKVKMLLLAAKGRESFYEQFGFVSRPNDHEGCGMNMFLQKE
ncbi:GNAT family N-acetyltransferase [Treponema sp.]|uniref:GNAT family N-acetyltransferase n=1 Tax=Treponema sp. TaxID=166 RepID=UPI00298EA3F7|nr:GNAT family N-acetyltransferase [Treponema sp.]MCQ2241121.1 GNAT family N-acetyltransferase [Treponema sp.]